MYPSYYKVKLLYKHKIMTATPQKVNPKDKFLKATSNVLGSSSSDPINL